MKAIVDTSILIAREQHQELASLPDEFAVSVMTLAELMGGVLMAADVDRSRRMQTLRDVETGLKPLPVDEAVARAYANMAAESRRLGRKPGIIDMLIAATAIANDLPLYTQDADQATLPGVQAVLV
jgi:predicted nucleic acid-binding protein